MDLKRMFKMPYLTFERASFSGTLKLKCDENITNKNPSHFLKGSYRSSSFPAVLSA